MNTMNTIRNFVLISAMIGTLAAGLLIGQSYVRTIHASMQRRVNVYEQIVQQPHSAHARVREFVAAFQGN